MKLVFMVEGNGVDDYGEAGSHQDRLVLVFDDRSDALQLIIDLASALQRSDTSLDEMGRLEVARAGVFREVS